MRIKSHLGFIAMSIVAHSLKILFFLPSWLLSKFNFYENKCLIVKIDLFLSKERPLNM
jgi:hypothetical protein